MCQLNLKADANHIILLIFWDVDQESAETTKNEILESTKAYWKT